MTDIRRIVLGALPKDLLLDLEDRLSAEALKAFEVVRKEFALSAKRSREAEGQIRFRLQEQGYEEVVQEHGGCLISDGIMLNTDLKIFQPFARFPGPEFGVVLGFAAMPEPKKLPPKNRSRAAGVTLNFHLQPTLFSDENTPKPTDVFALFLTARDRDRAGLIEEIAIGVIGSDYKEFTFYESLDTFLGGYGVGPQEPAGPDQPGPGGGEVQVKLRKQRKLYIPPENQPRTQVGDEAAE